MIHLIGGCLPWLLRFGNAKGFMVYFCFSEHIDRDRKSGSTRTNVCLECVCLLRVKDEESEKSELFKLV